MPLRYAQWRRAIVRGARRAGGARPRISQTPFFCDSALDTEVGSARTGRLAALRRAHSNGPMSLKSPPHSVPECDPRARAGRAQRHEGQRRAVDTLTPCTRGSALEPEVGSACARQAERRTWCRTSVRACTVGSALRAWRRPSWTRPARPGRSRSRQARTGVQLSVAGTLARGHLDPRLSVRVPADTSVQSTMRRGGSVLDAPDLPRTQLVADQCTVSGRSPDAGASPPCRMHGAAGSPAACAQPCCHSLIGQRARAARRGSWLHPEGDQVVTDR